MKQILVFSSYDEQKCQDNVNNYIRANYINVVDIKVNCSHNGMWLFTVIYVI